MRFIFRTVLVFSSCFSNFQSHHFASSSEYSLFEYLTTSMSCDTSGFLDRRYFSNKDWGIVPSLSGYTHNNLILGKENNMIWKNYSLNRKPIKKQLLKYKVKDVVHCLDSFVIRENRSVYIHFIGDSLVRNQFLNFVSVSNVLFL
jgi:hypothetical protein